MSELDEALARLEAAVARLEAAAPASAGPPGRERGGDERLVGVATALARQLDSTLARLGRLLEREE